MNTVLPGLTTVVFYSKGLGYDVSRKYDDQNGVLFARLLTSAAVLDTVQQKWKVRLTQSILKKYFPQLSMIRSDQQTVFEDFLTVKVAFLLSLIVIITSFGFGGLLNCQKWGECKMLER
jgi:hypothetical protein